MPHAFGLALTGAFPVPGTEGAAPPGLPRVALERAARAEVLADWPDDVRDISRRRGMLIQATPQDDLLIRATSWGLARISDGASHIACAPPSRGGAARFGRFAVAQVLPFAALLHGREVFHASVVDPGGGAVLLTGPSGTGKTTVAAAWRSQGAAFVADDVAAVTLDAGRPLVHPGPGMASSRDGEGWHPVPRVQEVRPVRAVVLLRRAGQAGRVRVAAPAGRLAPLLLGSTFNAAWHKRDRALRQLDACEALGREAQVLEVTTPGSRGPQDVVAALERALA